MLTCAGENKTFTYKVTVPPAQKAIDLILLKDYLRIDQSDLTQDSILNLIIDVVTEVAEKITHRDFITRTYVTYRNKFNNNIFLLRSPLQSVESITYIKNGITETVSNSVYSYSLESDFSSVFLKEDESWPNEYDLLPYPIQITFKTGYGDNPSDIPATLRLAMLKHAADVYTNRGDCGCDAKTLENAIPGDLLQMYLYYKIIDINIGRLTDGVC